MRCLLLMPSVGGRCGAWRGGALPAAAYSRPCRARPTSSPCAAPWLPPAGRPRGLAKRVIACLDVRANDSGDLVVTKGDQYDVRESGSTGEVRGGGAVL